MQSSARLQNLLKASMRRQNVFRHVKRKSAWKRAAPGAQRARDRAAEGIILERALWTLPLSNHPKVRPLVIGREIWGSEITNNWVAVQCTAQNQYAFESEKKRY